MKNCDVIWKKILVKIWKFQKLNRNKEIWKSTISIHPKFERYWSSIWNINIKELDKFSITMMPKYSKKFKFIYI